MFDEILQTKNFSEDFGIYFPGILVNKKDSNFRGGDGEDIEI